MLFFWSNDYHVFLTFLMRLPVLHPHQNVSTPWPYNYLSDCDLIITTLLMTNSSDRTAKSSSLSSGICFVLFHLLTGSGPKREIRNTNIVYITVQTSQMRERADLSGRRLLRFLSLKMHLRCLKSWLSVYYWGKSSCSFLFRNNGLTF